MTTLSSKQVAELVAVAERLTRLVESLQSGSQQVDAATKDMVEKKIAGRICLACGEKCPADEIYRRGLDVAHYTHAWRLIESGKATEQELMATGQLGPKKQPGKARKASSLDSFEKTDAATEGPRIAERSRATAEKNPKKKPRA
jgi:hypothetical protein